MSDAPLDGFEDPSSLVGFSTGAARITHVEATSVCCTASLAVTPNTQEAMQNLFSVALDMMEFVEGLTVEGRDTYFLDCETGEKRRKVVLIVYGHRQEIVPRLLRKILVKAEEAQQALPAPAPVKVAARETRRPREAAASGGAGRSARKASKTVTGVIGVREEVVPQHDGPPVTIQTISYQIPHRSHHREYVNVVTAGGRTAGTRPNLPSTQMRLD